MQATALERLQATAQAITLPKTLDAAQVTSWWVRPGQLVNAGDTLATVGAGNMRRGIVSPIAGKVRALTVREGATVQAGATLAYVEPEGPPQARQHAPQRASGAQRSEPPIVASNGNGRRGHVVEAATAGIPAVGPIGPTGKNLPIDSPQSDPDAATAEISAVEPMGSKPKPKPATRERTKHRGFYILPSQEKRLKRIVADLALDDDRPLACNDSLLVRAAIDVLLSLPPAALRATVATYKEREAAAQVGSGWPRPGKR